MSRACCFYADRLKDCRYTLSADVRFQLSIARYTPLASRGLLVASSIVGMSGGGKRIDFSRTPLAATLAPRALRGSKRRAEERAAAYYSPLRTPLRTPLHPPSSPSLPRSAPLHIIKLFSLVTPFIMMLLLAARFRSKRVNRFRNAEKNARVFENLQSHFDRWRKTRLSLSETTKRSLMFRTWLFVNPRSQSVRSHFQTRPYESKSEYYERRRKLRRAAINHFVACVTIKNTTKKRETSPVGGKKVEEQNYVRKKECGYININKKTGAKCALERCTVRKRAAAILLASWASTKWRRLPKLRVELRAM